MSKKKSKRQSEAETDAAATDGSDSDAKSSMALSAAIANALDAFQSNDLISEDAPAEEEAPVISTAVASEFDLNLDPDEDILLTEAAIEEVETPLEAQDPLPVQEIEGVEDSELAQYASAAIEQLDFVEDEKIESIIESILFATDRPVSLNSLKMAFKGTQVSNEKIRKTLDRLSVEYAGARRGISLEEVPGGFQLRTKLDNLDFLRRTVKARPFKLSGPALEVLAIAAYKQPVIKTEIDQIRGVESGHLLRALMERGLVQFEGKSDFPGRPMLYATTKKFLEIFGLRNLKELPTLSQIDELLPDGIGEDDADEKPNLSHITDTMSESVNMSSYSDGEDELEKIQEQLASVDTTTEFFEKEKQRQKDERDQERAQSIREALALATATGEVVPTKDIRWLKKYDEDLAAGVAKPQITEEVQPSLLDSRAEEVPQTDEAEHEAPSDL